MAAKGSFELVAQNIKRIKENAHRELKATFAVSYKAPYAIYVHENLQIKHKNGQAKFLEQPLRENTSVMSKMVKDLMKQGKSLREALLETANWLLEQSKKLVPVDTGRLRDSGSVRIVHKT